MLLYGWIGMTAWVLLFNGKNLYCGYWCPMGAAQELIAKAGPANLKIGASLGRVLQYGRDGLLLTLCVLLLVGLSVDLTHFEPFPIFTPQAASFSTLILAGGCLLMSLFCPRFWCRFLCPTGRILNLFKGILRRWWRACH